eukprot:Sspe_Gene.7036::Locus_2372_Transcript_1_2_Confidence_0.667_Length_1364::g.7036::m.7036
MHAVRGLPRRLGLFLTRPSPVVHGACRKCSDEPAWVEEQRRKYLQEEARRKARKAAAAEEERLLREELKGDLSSLDDEDVPVNVSDDLPVVEKDGWLVWEDHTSYPDTFAEKEFFASEEEAKYYCIKKGYGGFVQRMRFMYYFRPQHPCKLVRRRERTKKDDMEALFVRPEQDGTPAMDSALQNRLQEAVANGTAPERKDPVAEDWRDEDDDLLMDDGDDDGVEQHKKRDKGGEYEEEYPDVLEEVDPDDHHWEPKAPRAREVDDAEYCVAVDDITINGKLAVEGGTRGKIISSEGTSERVRVEFEERADGRDGPIDVYEEQLTRLE